ncbi:uncharacterized protein LOC142170330 [Nicotiana tabacum]|uniref:Uncharacterized protein LOC142170330 n=1 Tax=Nicotiana tabacum TaxID=4097 RepID=A0AC58STP5_TOBAC
MGIGGDFNVIRFEDEKLGRARNTKAIREFNKTIQDLSLLDLPLHGDEFTWYRSIDNQCASRLDRFLISERWDEPFKFIKQRTLPRVTSDHCPIILECGEWNKGKSYFKFENMWCEHKDFVTMHLLDAFKWNKEVYGNLEERKARATSRLERMDEERAHSQNNEDGSERVSVIKELEEIAIAEEIKSESWRPLWVEEGIEKLTDKEKERIHRPFLMEEVETVIRLFKGDKAPGPDGFNMSFFQKCWSIVKGDV